jgi:hypothetical protein
MAVWYIGAGKHENPYGIVIAMVSLGGVGDMDRD